MTTATVGLLFSDIEGSTRLLQELGPDYGAVLIAHRDLLEAAFLAHHGEVQGTEGDSRSEVAELDLLLADARLLTVTGAGGAGNSRIALRVAAQQGGRFEDGVWFVDLAPVSDPHAVAQQIALAMGHSDLAAADLGETIGQRAVLLLIAAASRWASPAR